MSSCPKPINARGIFESFFNGQTSPVTPIPKSYGAGQEGDLVYEVSEGKDCEGKTIYGVTTLRRVEGEYERDRELTRLDFTSRNDASRFVRQYITGHEPLPFEETHKVVLEKLVMSEADHAKLLELAEIRDQSFRQAKSDGSFRRLWLKKIEEKTGVSRKEIIDAVLKRGK